MYHLTTRLWPNEGEILVKDVQGVRIATLSVEFLRRGHVLTWDYVLQACHAVVNETGRLFYGDEAGKLASSSQASSSSDPRPVAVRLDEIPVPGRYRFLCSQDPTQPTTWATGPRFKFKYRGADSPDASTMSHSSRSTANQTGFRHALWRRDGLCVILNVKSADAAHILPQSRPEYYEEVLGSDPVNYFHVSFGLLLDRNLHSSFDRGEWALYPDPKDPSNLIVHIFQDDQFSMHHGLIIPPSRFRVTTPLDLPDRRLLDFHYKQCMIKHFRGFDSFPEPTFS